MITTNGTRLRVCFARVPQKEREDNTRAEREDNTRGDKINQQAHKTTPCLRYRFLLVYPHLSTNIPYQQSEHSKNTLRL